MRTCECCGEEYYRTHGSWCNDYDGWVCGDCQGELRAAGEIDN